MVRRDVAGPEQCCCRRLMGGRRLVCGCSPWRRSSAPLPGVRDFDPDWLGPDAVDVSGGWKSNLAACRSDCPHADLGRRSLCAHRTFLDSVLANRVDAGYILKG